MLNDAGAIQAALGAMERQRTAADQRANAEAWADVFVAFFADAANPPPGPARGVAIDGARAAAVELLAVSTFATGAVQVSAVAALFGAALVASTLGAVATPPPAPFVPIGSLVSSADAAAAFVGSLRAWALTGTATLLAPGSPPLPWA